MMRTSRLLVLQKFSFSFSSLFSHSVLVCAMVCSLALTFSDLLAFDSFSLCVCVPSAAIKMKRLVRTTSFFSFYSSSGSCCCDDDDDANMKRERRRRRKKILDFRFENNFKRALKEVGDNNAN